MLYPLVERLFAVRSSKRAERLLPLACGTWKVSEVVEIHLMYVFYIERCWMVTVYEDMLFGLSDDCLDVHVFVLPLYVMHLRIEHARAGKSNIHSIASDHGEILIIGSGLQPIIRIALIADRAIKDSDCFLS